MAYRPPTTSKYAPADPLPGRRPASFAPRAYQPRPVKEVPKTAKPLTEEDFPAISAWKPVSKSNSATSLASNVSNVSDLSATSASSISTKPLTMAERMKIKLAEEEEARLKREEEEKRNRDKTAEELERERSFANMVIFSRITERVAEERWKSNTPFVGYSGAYPMVHAEHCDAYEYVDHEDHEDHADHEDHEDQADYEDEEY